MSLGLKTMKQIFKKFLQNIKSWGWYDWLKYLLFIFMVVIGVFLLFLPFNFYILELLMYYIIPILAGLAFFSVIACLITNQYSQDKYVALFGGYTIASVCLLFIGLFVGLVGYITTPDYKDIVYDECIELRKKEGYSEDFSRKYCFGPSRGCEKKLYSKDCNPELYCCFVTIEEDKEWNYLDYDEKGNKIRE